MHAVVVEGGIMLLMVAIFCVSLLSIRSSLVTDAASARRRLLTLFTELLGGFNSVWFFVYRCIINWKSFYLHGFAFGIQKSLLDLLEIAAFCAAFCVGVPLVSLLLLKLASLTGFDGLFGLETMLKVVPEDLR